MKKEKQGGDITGWEVFGRIVFALFLALCVYKFTAAIIDIAQWFKDTDRLVKALTKEATDNHWIVSSLRDEISTSKVEYAPVDLTPRFAPGTFNDK